MDSSLVSSYNWSPVPSQIENNTTIKIVVEATEGSGEDEVKGVSNPFNIMGNFTLVEPPATLTSGQAYTITWENYDLLLEIPNAKLEYYTGTAWRNIDYVSEASPGTGIVSNTESYSWTVPTDVRSTTCKFKISDPNNSNAFDETSLFEVRPVLSVTNPTSATKWAIGTTANNINFDITGPVTNVKIEYSKNNGTDYTYIINPSYIINNASGTNSYTYAWTIPVDQDIITTHVLGSEQKAKIRVLDTSLAAIYGSSGLFMMKAAITVTSPNAASPALKVGDIFNIEWTTPCTGFADMGNVKIEFRKSDAVSWSTIATVGFNTSPYSLWAPPNDSFTANVKTAKVKITDDDNTEVTHTSDAFEIEGKIELLAPNTSGILWQVNSTPQVQWRPTGDYSFVEIHYSKDNFATHEAFLKSVANVASGTIGTTTVTVPDDISKTVRVRVRDKDDPDVKAISGYDLNIVGSLDVTSPEQAGIVWNVGSTGKVISWTSIGTITNVKIEYKT